MKKQTRAQDYCLEGGAEQELHRSMSEVQVNSVSNSEQSQMQKKESEQNEKK